jgi:cytochrome P450
LENSTNHTAAVRPPNRPAHVPEHLVRPYPFFTKGDRMSVLPRTLIPAMHEYPPIFWAAGMHHASPGAWVPRRYKDLQQIYQDTDHFTTFGTGQFGLMIGENWVSVPIESEPPLHSQYRILLNPMFAPKQIALLDDHIRQFAREKLLEIAPKGACEFVSEFAFEFPIRVFLELMGLPQNKMAEFLEWEHGLLRTGSLEQVVRSVKLVTEYLAAECDERRRNPRKDLLTLVVEGEVDGRKLNEDELKGFCFNLFVGGLDTVSTNMSNQFRHLGEFPEHQNYLRANPGKIPDALEELMRAYAAVTTLRICKVDTEIGGIKMKAGDLVLMPTFLAANDSEIFPNPEVVDLARKPRHVSFGYGAHLCIGVHLARREMKIALEEGLSILPKFRIKPGAQIESYSAGTIGPISLPLVWDV